ncbi:MAG TPA: hypothetical protein VMX94_13270 [Armatimonadota bacterium]|nr:hypothetical protein [Armatimonadota bacterium]
MGGLAIARLSIIETMRRKEFYVILVLVVGLALWMQFMDISSSAAGRFAKDIVMQVTWLVSFGLAVPLAARQITSDVEQKTVYVFMSRPIHRWQYVFGRAAGAAAASAACFGSLFFVLVLMLLTKGVHNLADASLWQAFALQVTALVMLCAITVFFSTRATSAGAVTFSLLLLIMMRYGGPSILSRIETIASHGFVREAAWAAYLAMPHFEFFNISQRVVHGWGPLPLGLFAQILAYGTAYSIFVIALAALLFRRRWL